MLTSSSGRIPPICPAKTYYTVQKQASVVKVNMNKSYDSVNFSSVLAGEDAMQKNMVSRISQEVRTATTTGDIQALKRAVAAGEYVPDPMEIADKILFMVGDR